ncbi:MAG: YqiA/YcfP family alpha/beta fold hydrolase [Candidatus Cryptobacteroides sp.]
MELYEYARPRLLAGKKLLYVHGFASSGQSGSVRTLRTLLPETEIVAPDLPVSPNEALDLLRGIVSEVRPDVVVGTSMGAMYAEMLYGTDRILVNPAFQLADTILRNNGLGRQEYHNPRLDGETSFLVTKGLVEQFREVSGHCFEYPGKDLDRVYGLFGIHDTMVDTFGLFSEHYPKAIRFNGEHYLNDAAILHSVLPVLQWIDDAQEKRQKRVLFISLSEKIVRHSSGFPKAVEYLSRFYDLNIVANVPYNNPAQSLRAFQWCEANLGVPVWNRLTLSAHKNQLLGDYLIDACPEEDSGEDFLGTLVHFGSDSFRTWEDVMEFFGRLGGQ